MQEHRKRAVEIIADRFPKAKECGWPTEGIVDLMLDAQIEMPPLLSRTLDQLYLIGQAGPSLLQLISVTLQYNKMVETLAHRVRANVDSFNPPAFKESLSGHLRLIEMNIAESDRQLASIHDESSGGGMT